MLRQVTPTNYTAGPLGFIDRLNCEFRNFIIPNPTTMKKIIILMTFSLLWVACERDSFDKDDPTILEKDNFSEGIYMGYFVLDDQEYWCEIEFRGVRE